MICTEAFKENLFHIGLKHHNKVHALISLGESIDTVKRLAVHRYAIVFARRPGPAQLEETTRFKSYRPDGLLYASDVDHVEFRIERSATRSEFNLNQNPFSFGFHLNS